MSEIVSKKVFGWGCRSVVEMFGIESDNLLLTPSRDKVRIHVISIIRASVISLMSFDSVSDGTA